MGSAFADSTPGRAAGLPMAIAGVAIMVVILVLVLRARRARRRGTGPDAQFEEGSGEQ